MCIQDSMSKWILRCAIGYSQPDKPRDSSDVSIVQISCDDAGKQILHPNGDSVFSIFLWFAIDSQSLYSFLKFGFL